MIEPRLDLSMQPRVKGVRARSIGYASILAMAVATAVASPGAAQVSEGPAANAPAAPSQGAAAPNATGSQRRKRPRSASIQSARRCLNHTARL